MDGTSHNLQYAPSFDKEALFDRKKRYYIRALFSNDFNRRVIHLIVRWPGSVQYARVLASADYMQETANDDDLYFTGNQHGLGDAAFGLTRA